jgi:hypothetical protein
MTVAQFNVRPGSVRSRVLQYVRQHAGDWQDASSAREDLMIAIPDLTKANFSAIRPDIQKLIAEARQQNRLITTKEELPEPVAENGHFEIPPDLSPQGLAAVLGLLNKIGSLEQEAVGKQAEFGAIQGTLIKTNKTVQMLKDLVHKLVDAL